MMAKRQSEILVERCPSGVLHVWADENVGRVIKDIQGVADVMLLCGSYSVSLDPRYDADEVIAEIERLGKGHWPLEELSLEEEANALGQRVGRSGQLVYTITSLLQGAEDTYGDGYESALSALIEHLVGRLWHGDWS